VGYTPGPGEKGEKQVREGQGIGGKVSGKRRKGEGHEGRTERRGEKRRRGERIEEMKRGSLV
jgi:hypothetical protein